MSFRTGRLLGAHDLVSIVAQAMSRERAHRYANCGELVDELKRFSRSPAVNRDRWRSVL